MTHPLTELQDRIFHANRKQGFWAIPYPDDKPETVAAYNLLKKAEKIALMHSELSEALEGVRKPGPSDKIPAFTQEEEEMADALIRILDYCGGFDLRLAEAMEAKLAYNATRPFKHGKAF